MNALVTVIALMLLVSAPSLAAVPKEIAYQGFLTDGITPVEGPHGLRFAIYADSAVSQSPLWTEDHDGVPVANGVFKVLLGRRGPFPATLFDLTPGEERWLETTVDGQTLSPRTRLAAVPYAFTATDATHAVRADTAAFAETGGTGESVWQQNGQDIYYLGGNVGIGTANTTQRLRVAGGGILLDNNWAISWRDAANQTDVGAVMYDNQNRLLLRPGATERMTIDGNSGYVGIGTTQPPALLTVRRDDPNIGGVGPVLFLQNLSAPNNVGTSAELHFGRDEVGGLAKIKAYAADWYGQNYYLSFWTADGGTSYERLRITEEGKVGIGVTNPAGTLDLHGRFVVDATSPSPNRWNIKVGDGTGWRGNIVRDDGTPLVTFVDDGKVGIGTTNPTAKLDVAGDMCVTGAKNAIVPTSNGMTKLYCDESTESWFSDRGEARLVNGQARVELDPLFLETVSISEAHPMKVWVTYYGPHGNAYVVRGLTGFEVIDPDGGSAEFSWQVEAKRRGYEEVRLETGSQQMASE